MPPQDEAQAVRAESYRPSVNRYAQKLIARIQRNADDLEAIEALASHYEDEGDHPSFVNLMEGWGDTLEDASKAAAVYVRAAEASLAGMGDRTRAKGLYERALSRDASHPQALDRVLRLLEDAGDFERMKQVLKFVAFRLSEQRNQRDLSDGALHLATVHYRLGQVYERHFAEAGKAAASYRRAIEENPRLLPAIAAARKIYDAVGNTQAMAALYELEVEATPAPEDKRALLIALAEMKRRDEGNLDAAIVVLRRALKLGPFDVNALRLLADALIARAERAQGDDASVDLRRAAEVLYQVARSVPRSEASGYLMRAIELHPGHEKATALLRELSGYGSTEPQTHAQSHEPQLVVERRDTVRAASADALLSREASSREVLAPEVLAPETHEPREADRHAFDAAATTALPPATSLSPARNSAEVWLHEADFDHAHDLATGELIPIDDELGAEADGERNQHASTMPPSTLAEHKLPHLFPPHEILRAPRLPEVSELEPAAHSSWPSPEGDRARGRRSSMPPKASKPLASPIAPPPHPSTTSARNQHPTLRPVGAAERPDATLIAWHLPDPEIAPPLEAAARTPSDVPAPLVSSREISAAPSRPDSAPSSDVVPRVRARRASTAPATPQTATTASSPSVLSGREQVPGAEPDASSSARVVRGGLPFEPERISLEVNLGVTTTSNFYVGFDTRVRSGGIFVETYSPQELGTAVELLVTLPGELVARVYGRVKLVRDTVDPFSDEVPGMYVGLETLNEEALLLFERFVEKRPPMFIDE
jgi:tetratricopeptide (TPR) repeat protein